MKNKTIVLIVLIVVVLGAYFIFFNSKSNKTPTGTTHVNTPTAPDNSVVNVFVPVTTPTPVSNTPVTNTPKAPVQTTPKTPTIPKIPATSNVSVSINNFAFSPSTISVKVGSKVTWTNNDSVSHTVTSDSGTSINSPTLSPGQSYSVTFANAGSMSYHCTIHPSMHGTIVVTN
jgi:amicyanin